MDTTDPPILARWEVAGDARHAEQMAAVLLRRHRHASTGSTDPRVACGIMIVVGGGLVVLLWPWGAVVAAVLVALVAWVRWGAPRQAAKTVRRLPTATERYVVTLDAEGFHTVGTSFADHLRWRVFAAAAVDDGFLVLDRRGSPIRQAVSLDGLDPAVDRAWLAAEVNRLIDGDRARSQDTR